MQRVWDSVSLGVTGLTRWWEREFVGTEGPMAWRMDTPATGDLISGRPSSGVTAGSGQREDNGLRGEDPGDLTSRFQTEGKQRTDERRGWEKRGPGSLSTWDRRHRTEDSSTFRPQTTPGLERGSVLIHGANGRLLGENHRCRHPLQGVVGGGVGPLLVAGGPGEGYPAAVVEAEGRTDLVPGNPWLPTQAYRWGCSSAAGKAELKTDSHWKGEMRNETSPGGQPPCLRPI
ncbi:uncharacterized protein LOC119564092 isoform X1 [Chelonia mydas]|uniref:uncharacterized protein LOC119564092 isoform X1 n=1 Tax=Chelonia mydas TaxID=8469 RepID=UPI0018A1D2BA|nr:uncharacterized protein LOC119564092 isoform X1 [Chelonia mydas]